MMKSRDRIWLGFWLVLTLVSLGFAIALSSSPGQLILVGSVGLLVAIMVFASGMLWLLPWMTASSVERGSIDIPLVLLLVAAFVSFCFAVALWFFVSREYGLFVALWVPSILALAATIQATRR